MTDAPNDDLIMRFDPRVIDDLGAKLYSTLPPILSELIANGYDACAQNVFVDLYDDNGTDEKQIIIRDDGHGMNYEEVQTHYLVVGRKKRDEDNKRKCERAPIGKKGLGKLSFFGIARKAIIETVQDGEKVTFEMDLDAIHNAENGQYKPSFRREEVKGADGTTITLTGIYRKTEFDVEGIIKSISNYFIFDTDFKVFIRKSSENEYKEIDNSVRYEHPDRQPEYIWNFPKTALREEIKQFSFSKDVKGEIILFNKPVRSNLRGVTLFSRKKLVNLPEFFPVQGSSFFFQYLTGWLEVDFIDEIVPDVISTNRSSLAWNDESLSELREFLEEVIRLIQVEWRKLEQEARKHNIKENFQVDTDEWRETNKGNRTITENIDKLLPLLDDPEKVPNDELMKMFEIVHNLAPSHADFVLWSGLHQKITNNSVIRQKYFEKNYLEAAREAVQIYNEEVQTISNRTEDGFDLMNMAFGPEAGKLIQLTPMANQNEKNLELGQRYLSQGLMLGFKNPAVSHTSITAGQRNQMFTDRNCLDILGTISYLFDRLEKRTNPAP
ncbi:MAG: TIGR02391 family protein [Candidatus Saccharimonadaceae bacterium]